MKLNRHINKVVQGKYEKVAKLEKVKDDSQEQDRAFVKAYADYTHTVEALHNVMEHGNGHSGH